MNRPDAARTGDPRTEPVVGLAVCDGYRCAAVRAAGGPELRRAVRARPDAVLLSLPCLGRCHEGALALAGPAHAETGRVTWAGQPVVVSLLDRGDRLTAVTEWLAVDAPDRDALVHRLSRRAHPPDSGSCGH